MFDGIDVGILIWLLAGVLSGVGEFFTGTLFLLPFAIGAVVAAVAVVFGANTTVALLVFTVVTLAVLAVVLRFGRRFAEEPAATSEGANRYVGARGIVIADLTDQRAGKVQVGGDLWRALPGSGVPIKSGARIRVVAVQGNSLIVEEFAAETASD